MANIAFLLDFEVGHIFPTFGLAAALRERGHTVSYIGIPDIESLVRKNGFDFFPILSEFIPAGSIKQMPPQEYNPSEMSQDLEGPSYLTAMLCWESWDPFIRRIQPDIVISSVFITLEALIFYYITGITQVLFLPHLWIDHPEEKTIERLINQVSGDEVEELFLFAERKGLKITGIRDFTAPLRHFPVIIPCPKEFDLPEIIRPSHYYYIEPSIRLPGVSTMFQWPGIPPGAKIIYASLGTQNHIYNRERVVSFYRKVVEAMRYGVAGEWFLILSIGATIGVEEFLPLPPNVAAMQWVPQLEVLQRASIAITHGGLGTIKECIFYGVPMIVCPFDRDQPANAQRVKRHNLGVSIEISTASPPDIFQTVNKVLYDPGIRESVSRMQQVFRHYENEHTGVNLVEKFVTHCPSGNP